MCCGVMLLLLIIYIYIYDSEPQMFQDRVTLFSYYIQAKQEFVDLISTRCMNVLFKIISLSMHET